MTTLITAAKETKPAPTRFFLFFFVLPASSKTVSKAAFLWSGLL